MARVRVSGKKKYISQNKKRIRKMDVPPEQEYLDSNNKKKYRFKQLEKVDRSYK